MRHFVESKITKSSTIPYFFSCFATGLHAPQFVINVYGHAIFFTKSTPNPLPPKNT